MHQTRPRASTLAIHRGARRRTLGAMNPRRVWLLAVVVLAAASACEDPHRSTVGAPSATASQVSTATSATPSPAATQPLSLSPDKRPRLPASLGAAITGWSAVPRPVSAYVSRALGPAPTFPFSLRLQGSDEVVLYDMITRSERPMGSGFMPRFSPSGMWLAWAGGPLVDRPPFGREWTELRVLDLESGAVRSLGSARFIAGWIDDDHVGVIEPGTGQNSIRAMVDVRTGTRVTGSTVPADPQTASADAAGFRLESEPRWAATYRVTELATGVSFLFDAPGGATLSPDGKVIAATSTATLPDSSEIDRSAPWNIYVIDPRSRVATFVATTELGSPPSASQTHIMWQASVCSRDHALYLFERASGSLVRISGVIGTARFTPAGTIGVGGFQPTEFFDPATFARLVQFPVGFIGLQWSPDYRWAAVGAEGGRDSGCV